MSTIDTLAPRADAGHWRAHARVQKWHDEASLAAGLPPYEVVEAPDNILTNAGITRMLNLLIGAGGQALTNSYARLGVGDGTTAVVATDTDLSAGAGGTHRYFKGMDATFPSVASTTATFQTTYTNAEANFVWNEWGIDVGGAGTGATGTVVVAPLLNRRVPATSLGTKTGGSWTLTVTISIS